MFFAKFSNSVSIIREGIKSLNNKNQVRVGTFEIILLVLAFVGLQIWWISMTIKKGDRSEIDKWGRKIKPTKEDELMKVKKKLEEIFKN